MNIENSMRRRVGEGRVSNQFYHTIKFKKDEQIHTMTESAIYNTRKTKTKT